MTTAELKSKLVKEINKLEDLDLLNSIDLFIEFNKNIEEPYLLNEVQKKLIEKSEKDFNEGRTHTNEEVFKEIDEWLKGK